MKMTISGGIKEFLARIGIGQWVEPPLPDTAEEIDAEWYRSINCFWWQSAKEKARRAALERRREQLMCDFMAARVSECQAALGEIKLRGKG